MLLQPFPWLTEKKKKKKKKKENQIESLKMQLK